MKSVLWFVLGIAGGFVLAHLVDKDPRGHELLAEVDARISEFTDRIGDAYREQEAKIDGIAADVAGVTADAAPLAD
ncbi:ATPase [Microbacterium sp.]|uniref:ATPase n=1 Tax=Microbacterium sp. TaxID=51671 RepID=UPI0039E45960